MTARAPGDPSTLLTGFYRDPDDGRRGELAECLRRNAAHERIGAIHVLVEDDTPAAELIALVGPGAAGKLHVVARGERLTFAALFAHAERLAPRRVIVANADIFFDTTLALLDDVDLAGQLLCLSRWDERPGRSPAFFEHTDSQDAWIFDPPLPPFPCAFPLGVPGCDNRLVWEAARAGVRVSNPSRSVRARHLHATNIRHYTERQRLAGPGQGLAATTLRTPRRQLTALTSLPVDPAQAAHLRQCLQSWREAGMRVVSFNHPDEHAALRGLYDAELVGVERTSCAVFGRHFVPIATMVGWAREAGVPALVVNADITIALDAAALFRLRHLTGDGLTFLVRHNHQGAGSRVVREPHGIDAFLFDGRQAPDLPESFLSMGQPFWDYWLPHVYAEAGRRLHTVDVAAALHRDHPTRWNWDDWLRCAHEFARTTGWRFADQSFEAAIAGSAEVRRRIDARTTVIGREPFAVRPWITRRLGGDTPKVVLELGAHEGEDTAWLAALPGVTVHAFEPDPRNHPPALPNVVAHRQAIADRDGAGELTLSLDGWGREWTYSSSIRQPAGHLGRYPVRFGGAVPVELTTLDTFAATHGLGPVEFIWADIQGAEGDLVRGGMDTLARTRYLYTEYSDDELYAGQPTLDDLLRMLPAFRVVELWPDDVLLQNTRLA